MVQNSRKTKETSEVIYTPTGRVSFPYVFEKNDFNDIPKYELTLLFPPDTDLSALKAAARKAAAEKWGDKPPRSLRSPFRDADEKSWIDGYEPDWTFVTFRTSRKPGVVNSKVEPILDLEEFYPGCWARVTCTPYAYHRKGNCGVAFGLQNVQKMRDDETFAGGSSAEDDFGPVSENFSAANDDIFREAPVGESLPF